MFDALADRLQETFARLRGHGRLSEAQVDAALREVRLALLEADVNFRVVKDFVGRVRARAVAAGAGADRSGRDVVIVDTAGRLAVDTEMMAQAAAIKEAIDPNEVLLV